MKRVDPSALSKGESICIEPQSTEASLNKHVLSGERSERPRLRAASRTRTPTHMYACLAAAITWTYVRRTKHNAWLERMADAQNQVLSEQHSRDGGVKADQS